uniref:Uncharacterized protein n=1 Tax=Oryza sativa subsp. japonica TaxID=39947 RepID=Q6YUZ5_ORYSJ|nr:hypothetical protein [Oryza sativa Japonica Group]
MAKFSFSLFFLPIFSLLPHLAWRKLRRKGEEGGKMEKKKDKKGEKKEEERKNKKVHVIVHVACHVDKTTVKRGFGPEWYIKPSLGISMYVLQYNVSVSPFGREVANSDASTSSQANERVSVYSQKKKKTVSVFTPSMKAGEEKAEAGVESRHRVDQLRRWVEKGAYAGGGRRTPAISAA